MLQGNVLWVPPPTQGFSLPAGREEELDKDKNGDVTDLSHNQASPKHSTKTKNPQKQYKKRNSKKRIKPYKLKKRIKHTNNKKIVKYIKKQIKM